MTSEQEQEYAERFQAMIRNIAATLTEPLQQRIEDLEQRVAALEPQTTANNFTSTQDLMKPSGIMASVGQGKKP